MLQLSGCRNPRRSLFWLINDSGHQLLVIINDLMVFPIGGQGQAAAPSCPGVLAEVQQGIAEAATTKGPGGVAAASAGHPAASRGDARLRRTLNKLRRTRSSSEARRGVHYRRDPARRMRWCVCRRNGSGIRRPDQGRYLRELRTQMGRRTQQYGGTGLGTSPSHADQPAGWHHRIEQHAPGKGSRFLAAALHASASPPDADR